MSPEKDKLDQEAYNCYFYSEGSPAAALFLLGKQR
jgi:hypothetical protein